MAELGPVDKTGLVLDPTMWPALKLELRTTEALLVVTPPPDTTKLTPKTLVGRRLAPEETPIEVLASLFWPALTLVDKTFNEAEEAAALVEDDSMVARAEVTGTE